MTDFTNDQLDAFLDQEFEHFGFNAVVTPRRYLIDLLLALWNEGESFSGKRPFGDSGWQSDLAVPAILSGAIAGEIDEGWADGYEINDYEALVTSAIARLGGVTLEDG